ncbi:hypothetical protein EV363DRAFT_1205874, partial [Boletus edulis]
MSDDFFSNVPLDQSTAQDDERDDFAHAISLRFGSTDLRTARLLPDDLNSTPHCPTQQLSHPHPPRQRTPPRPPSPPQTFIPVLPSALAPFLTDPHSLILDIRPHAAHAAARINNALSLSVPTTLLKRPLFSLSKLSQMLPSPSSRAHFANWSCASCILVYDSDSTFSPDNSIIAGLLRKFRAEGFSGELGWVRGGFQAVWREARDLATTEPPSPEEEDPDAAFLSGTLRTTHLPKAAFSLSSTTVAPPPHLGPVPSSIPLLNTPAPSTSRAANPFFDTIRQNVELSHGITERIPLRLPRHPDENDPNVEEGAEALAMQFYRIELAEQRRLRSIMEHHTRESSAKDGAGVTVRTGAKSVPGTPHTAVFPFSITAGVEKGTKNRYTHIWPFEHARVRLHDSRHLGSHLGRLDDYVNASYVQPLCTRKRYIATQGPLPSTYVDFWTLVWEQNVHVIVMLTREVENAMIKCGSYWTDTEYGPLRLELLSTSPPMSPSANPTTMDISTHGFFAIREPQGKTSEVSRAQPTLITRTFLLSHSSYSGVPPRRITHLQYLDWSDMNVPDDPRGVLDLVKKVEQAVAESTPGPSPYGSLSPGSWRRGRRGSEWRHPELDLKSGIASFALGKAPVLLHCSAGVGRTGGFIAVDAMLDGIRRELRQNREERSCGMEDESERMDVDGPTTGKAEETRGPLQMIKTVPIPVTAGDRMKGRRRHNHSKDPSWEKQRSSSELLVVHVPCAGTNDAPDDTNGVGIDLHDAKEADWQSSTREWVEKVSDQTCAHTQGGSLPPPPLLPPPSGERSPGSTSNSSGSSALNSADDSMGGSASADASGSAKSGVGSRVERKSDTGSASGSGNASGNWRPPPSLLSKPGSGSISLSTSGSGTGTGSRFGSSLLRARLRDSSVTSISAKSTDSLLPPKSSAPLDRPSSALHSSPSSNMEIDCPPRSVSVPLQLTYSSAVSLQRGIHSRHDKPILGFPSVARFLSPILPQGMAQKNTSFGSDEVEAPTSRPNSGPDSSELTTLPQEFESGESPGAEGRGKNNQGVSDESEEIVIPSKSETNLWLNTELSSLKVPAILHSGDAARNPPLPSIQIKDEGAVPLATRIPDDSALEQFPTASGVLGSSEQDQHAADHPVIDYKLPRELHSDLSPPPISSFTEPICAVIQDMREQRMSLCQSLRQYVFVHAAIIEGALRIVDEERELWGYSGTSDDASSAEGEPRATIREDGRWPWDSEAEAWASRVDVVAMMPKPEHCSILQRSRSLHTMTQPPNAWGLKGHNKCSLSLGPTSSSSSVSSPSKGKRAPSPTELLREDKTGALTLNKRPSIRRK